MSAKTTIEWATRSWNPVRGCSRVSPGCDNCYAMNFAHRFSGAGKPYEGLTTIRKGRVDWSGVARFIPDAVGEPLRWRKPERVFVNSMSDLFHHSLTFEQVAAVFAVMAACPLHTFLVLTKRPERAVEFFAWLDGEADGHEWSSALASHYAINCRAPTLGIQSQKKAALLDAFSRGHHRADSMIPWPLPNVHLGVSIEDQRTADMRLPLLLRCPAAVHWVSYEPALGPVDFSRYLDVGTVCECPNPAPQSDRCEGKGSKGWIRCAWGMRRLRWIVCGGESGPRARPFDVGWARSVVEQARRAPGWGHEKDPCRVFMKQFGAKPYEVTTAREVRCGGPASGLAKSAKILDDGRIQFERWLKDRKGGDLTEIPGDWPREFPRAV